MKSVALAVVTGQSWGFAWAKSMKFRPFATISTALEPCGKLGVASTFEAEIEFAKSVLAAAALPHFVMMDEIFHSTNATDGVAASQVFLRQLYEKKQTISIVSTHYRELTQMFAKETQQLQLVATEDVNGKLVYSYMIAPGVSTKSSVMEILAERGLLMESTPGK
jgi:DNA mismatch repair ATPase MutS